MKVRITVTNDEGQVDFNHEYEQVEHFEIGHFQPFGFDQANTGKFHPKLGGIFTGAEITLILKNKQLDEAASKVDRLGIKWNL